MCGEGTGGPIMPPGGWPQALCWQTLERIMVSAAHHRTRCGTARAGRQEGARSALLSYLQQPACAHGKCQELGSGATSKHSDERPANMCCFKEREVLAFGR